MFELNEFEQRLKSTQNRFQLNWLKSRNIEYNFKWNQPYLSGGLSRRFNSLNSASDYVFYLPVILFWARLRTLRSFRFKVSEGKVFRLLEARFKSINDSLKMLKLEKILKSKTFPGLDYFSYNLFTNEEGSSESRL